MEYNVTEDAAESVAIKLLDAWGGIGNESLSEDQFIECSGLDEETGRHLARIVRSFGGEKSIRLADLTECLRVLKSNVVVEQVRLLFIFMDTHSNGRIHYDVMKKFVWMVDERGIERLGFAHLPDADHSFSYEELLRAVENSPRGEAAIALFCGQLFRLLTQSLANPPSIVAEPPSLHPIYGHIHNLVTCGPLVFKRHISKEQRFICVLVLLQMLFWLINFFYYLRTRHMPLPFCIAKGFGLNLRVITIAIYASMMRRTIGYLYQFSQLRPFLPLGFNIQVHSFLGFSLVFHAFGHMLGHIVYYERQVRGGFTEAFQQESLLRTGNWAKRGKGDAITGYILLTFLLLMARTALYRGKSSSYFRTFFLVHYWYNLWPVFIFLHVPDLWPYFVAISAAIILERAYDFFYMTIFSTLSASRACSNGVTFLSVPRGRDTYPGSYYRVKIPSISATEWHPFSLAGSVSSHHLTFFVASVGDWTRALYNIVSDPVLRETTRVQVQGPFTAPARWAAKVTTEPTLLVASGIGITPFFSLMATKVADELSFQSDKEVYQELFQEEVTQRRRSLSTVKALQKMSLETSTVINSDLEELRVVWMIRDCGELLFYLDYVHQLVKSQHSLSRHVVYVDVYVTGVGKGCDPVQMVAQTLFLLTVSELTSEYMNIHFGRPDLADVMQKNKPQQVYYCGGVVIKALLGQLCYEHGAQFHPEDCGSSTTFIPSIEMSFATWWACLVKKTPKVLRQRSHAAAHENTVAKEDHENDGDDAV